MSEVTGASHEEPKTKWEKLGMSKEKYRKAPVWERRGMSEEDYNDKQTRLARRIGTKVIREAVPVVLRAKLHGIPVPDELRYIQAEDDGVNRRLIYEDTSISGDRVTTHINTGEGIGNEPMIEETTRNNGNDYPIYTITETIPLSTQYSNKNGIKGASVKNKITYHAPVEESLDMKDSVRATARGLSYAKAKVRKYEEYVDSEIRKKNHY